MPKRRYLPQKIINKLQEAEALLVQGGTVGGARAKGERLRESVHVDDLANAVLFLLPHYSAEGHVKVGPQRT